MGTTGDPPLPTGHVYTYAAPRRLGSREQLIRTPLAEIRRAVMHHVDHESPIRVERVARGVAACWGIEDVGPSERWLIERAIRQAAELGFAVRRGDFLFLPSQRIDTLGFRGADAEGRVRPIEDIAPEEIAAAVLAALRPRGELEWAKLTGDTVRALGLPSASDRVVARVQSAIELLVAEGLARRSGRGVAIGDGESQVGGVAFKRPGRA